MKFFHLTLTHARIGLLPFPQALSPHFIFSQDFYSLDREALHHPLLLQSPSPSSPSSRAVSSISITFINMIPTISARLISLEPPSLLAPLIIVNPSSSLAISLLRCCLTQHHRHFLFD